MTDLVLRDIDPIMAARIRKVAEMNNWTVHETILHLIERGLYASEGGALRFDSKESDVMQSVIASLETLPNDPGFSLIGRVGHAAPLEPEPQPEPPAEFDPDELERYFRDVPIGSKLGGEGAL
jgi:hypothetical protein